MINLPLDVLSYIGIKLIYKDLLNFCISSKTLFRLFNYDEFWKLYTKRYFIIELSYKLSEYKALYLSLYSTVILNQRLFRKYDYNNEEYKKIYNELQTLRNQTLYKIYCENKLKIIEEKYEKENNLKIKESRFYKRLSTKLRNIKYDNEFIEISITYNQFTIIRQNDILTFEVFKSFLHNELKYIIPIKLGNIFSLTYNKSYIIFYIYEESLFEITMNLKVYLVLNNMLKYENLPDQLLIDYDELEYEKLYKS